MIKLEDHIIEEDENLVAVNKPSGLLTIPDREGKEISLKQMLFFYRTLGFRVHEFLEA